MTIKFAPKNTYRDELELRGFPVDEKRYNKMVEIQQKREEENRKLRNDTKRVCKQTIMTWEKK
ncbi:MAG: hypothetical protein H8E11_04415 [Candidatus Cloacimonetes bacterium]|nr:hypothetical protein [Candidatus Cloacimonadota bacterium]